MTAEQEVNEARGYLGRMLQSRYPQIHLLDDLMGVCTQVDNGFGGALRRCEDELKQVRTELDALKKWVELR